MEHAGEYLEAPVLGSKGVVEKGELVIMAAGAERLFQRAQSGLNAMGKKILYLGVWTYEFGNWLAHTYGCVCSHFYLFPDC